MVEREAVVSEGAEVGAAMIKEDNIFARGAKVKRIGLHGRSVVAVEEISMVRKLLKSTRAISWISCKNTWFRCSWISCHL